jgi:undecaprenyl-diphosphatase
MIEEFKYFLLGLIQGVAEFFPISSSGHLLLLSSILDVAEKNPLLLSITVHFATTLSTIVIYHNKLKKILFGIIKQKDKVAISYVLKILISSIPILIVGLFLKDYVEELFNNSILIVLIMLFITGCVLLSTTFFSLGEKRISYYYAFLIGLAQAVAILPGISRSGATISTALFLKIDKKNAADFSFIMVLLPIIGITFLELIIFTSSEIQLDFAQMKGLVIAFITSFISGVFACKYMISIVQHNNLKYFGLYCILVAILGFFI